VLLPLKTCEYAKIEKEMMKVSPLHTCTMRKARGGEKERKKGEKGEERRGQ